MSRLAIVIVSFNARADLVACLESLRGAPPAIPHDIVVVDNASADGSVEAAGAFTGVDVVALERNAGFSAANNVGIRRTHTDLVLLLNSDTIVPAGSIDRLVERLLATPAAAAAGPRLVDGGGREEISFGRMITPFNELRQKIVGRLYEARWRPAERWVRRVTARERFVDWISGACLLVRRADADAVGLLDERFFIYTEDVDFCASLRTRGRSILFTPAAQVTHLRGRSRAAAPAAANAAYRRSHVAFYEKHHPRWARVLRTYLEIRGRGVAK